MTTTTKSHAIIYPLSIDEKKKLCGDWQKTGLSKSAFMREHNLPPVFNHWCNKFLPKPESAKTSSTAPIAGPDDEWLKVATLKSTSKTHNINEQLIEFGLVCYDLKLNFCMPMAQIINFVKELRHATTTAQ